MSLWKEWPELRQRVWITMPLMLNGSLPHAGILEIRGGAVQLLDYIGEQNVMWRSGGPANGMGGGEMFMRTGLLEWFIR